MMRWYLAQTKHGFLTGENPGVVLTTFLDGDARTWYLASNPKISDYVQLRTPKYQGSLNLNPKISTISNLV